MRDEYAEAMLKLIEKKRARDKDIVETGERRQRGPAKVVDLMEVLKQSLEARREVQARGIGRKCRRQSLEGRLRNLERRSELVKERAKNAIERSMQLRAKSEEIGKRLDEFTKAS